MAIESKPNDWRKHLGAVKPSRASIAEIQTHYEGLSQHAGDSLERHLAAIAKNSPDIPSYNELCAVAEIMHSKFAHVMQAVWNNDVLMDAIASDPALKAKSRRARLDEVFDVVQGQDIWLLECLNRLTRHRRNESNLLGTDDYRFEIDRLATNMPVMPIRDSDVLLDKVTAIFAEKQAAFTNFLERYGDKLNVDAKENLTDLRVLAEGAANIARNLEPASEVAWSRS